MGISNYVDITITSATGTVTAEGFGTPLIVSYNATFSERVQEYTDIADLPAAGMATTTPEYKAAAALMAQDIAPASFKIGRGALPPTQTYTITPVASSSAVYSGTVDGTAWTFTSDASATLAEVCTGIAAAIDALASASFTVTSTGTTVTVVAVAAGSYIAVSVDEACVSRCAIAQDHVDPGVATDLAAIDLEDDDWYALLTCFNSEAMVNATASWVETADKFYFVSSVDSAIVTTTDVGTDVASDQDAANNTRTFVCYHPEEYIHFDAAWVGKRISTDPGTENWAFAQPAGIRAVTLTPTQRTNLINKSANSIEAGPGRDVTFLGTAGSGDFADFVRFKDFLKARVGEAVFDLLTQDEKIPFTDEGINRVKAAILSVLRANVQSGALAADPKPTVTAPRAADVSSVDRAARNLPDIEFTCTYAGAVNHVEITGRISV